MEHNLPYHSPLALIRFSALEVLISALFILAAVALVFVYTYYGYEEILRVSNSNNSNNNGNSNTRGSVIFITYCYLAPFGVISAVIVLAARAREGGLGRELGALEDTTVEELVPIVAPDAREQLKMKRDE